MPELIDTITLRNKRNIYEDGNQYRVDHIRNRDERTTRHIPKSVVKFCYRELAGGEVDAGDAKESIQPHAERLGLRYTYGYKLRYYIQDVLLILVATGRASIRKESKKYWYDIG